MKKTPIIVVAGLAAVLGAGYLGGMHYVSNKTMDFLHAQVDKTNAKEKTHAEIQDENRGLFTSTAKIIVSDSGTTFSAPLTVHHGLFNTDVNSDDVRIDDHGQNALKAALGSTIENAKLAVHLHNSGLKENDFRGSDIVLTLPGQVVTRDEHSGSNVKLLNPMLKMQRDSDGRLVVTVAGDKLESSEGYGAFSNADAFSFALTYDAQWSEQLVQAANAYSHDDSEQNQQAFSNLIASHLPDIHVDMKNLKSKVGMGLPDSSVSHVVFDAMRDQPAAMTRFIVNMDGIGDGKGDAADNSGRLVAKVMLDQRVVDTVMALSHNSGANMEQEVVATAQASPRLMIEELRVSNGSMSVSVNGEISIDGHAVKSVSDLNPSVVVAKLTVNGLPKKVENMIKARGLNDVNVDQPVVITANKGSVAINGQKAF